MVSEPLLKFEPLYEGVLIKRYKRFLVDVKLDSGELVTAHCANTGPMKGVLLKEGRVRLRYVQSPTRKLSWTWEQAQVIDEKGSSHWIGVNTSLANTIILKAIQAGYFKKEFGNIDKIRREVVYGENNSSRIDLLLYPDNNNTEKKNIFIEVKNTTWSEQSIALFPDTVTKRGQKHLKELMHVLPLSRAVLIPCITRDDVIAFAPGDIADKEYGDLFRKAIRKGVEVIPCSFSFFRDSIRWEGKKILKDIQI